MLFISYKYDVIENERNFPDETQIKENRTRFCRSYLIHNKNWYQYMSEISNIRK